MFGVSFLVVEDFFGGGFPASLEFIKKSAIFRCYIQILKFKMKLAFLACLGTGGARRATRPIRFDDQRAFDFPETQTEKDNNWSLANRCGRAAVAGEDGDQRTDVTCPNVLLINTDDMSWADVSLNNPSKIVPTPNIDRLVSKGNSLKLANK